MVCEYIGRFGEFAFVHFSGLYCTYCSVVQDCGRVMCIRVEILKAIDAEFPWLKANFQCSKPPIKTMYAKHAEEK